MEVAPGRDVTHGHQTWQGDGDGTGHGGATWPCGHGKEMVMAPGMDVVRGHGGTARNGGGTWPWGHNEDMAVAQGRDVTRGHGGMARNGGGTEHGCGTRPHEHGKEWRWHQAWRWHMATKHGKEMVMAQGRDVTCGHMGTARNGGGTGQGCDMWPCGHGKEWRWQWAIRW